MQRTPSFLLLLFLWPVTGMAQQVPDSATAMQLEPVMVTAFEQQRPLLSANASVSLLSQQKADLYNKGSLVNGFNSLPGVRMEERSPGSYRLNIRGSSLRSPFGVRNVKVYWNNLPLTDPGGNTYFNQLALNNFSSLEIFKGPAGSMYGAGTGGLVLMHSIDKTFARGATVDYVTGSYGTQNILGSLRFGGESSQNLLTYSHTQGDGYRDHTRTRKDNVSFTSHIQINDRQQLIAAALLTDLYYQTPGGLNLAEFKANPRQARPAAGAFPSAEAARAAIFQKNILAGLTHQYAFSNRFSNSSSVYAALAHIQNPSFRNYERRIEPHFGGRTVFSYSTPMASGSLKLVAGGEWQRGYFNTQVFGNSQGRPDTMQTNDDIVFTNYSVFWQGDLELPVGLIISTGVSANKSNVEFTRYSEYPVLFQSRSYRNEWLPRLSLLKKLGRNNAVLASVSKGYSPPTVSELLPSTGTISTFLEAETGTNYELDGRFGFFQNRLRAEVSFFYFRMNNALVQRKDSSNADYYVNAGNTDQKGVELSLDYQHFFPQSNRLLKQFVVRAAQSFYHFVYGDYVKGTASYSGNKLPSVPDFTSSLVVSLDFRNGFFINTSLYAASRIYLTDNNSVYAPDYQVLGARLGWNFHGHTSAWQLYAGADNLLNQLYSLGNDINAAGGRYYNAAAGRNFYFGLHLGKN